MVIAETGRPGFLPEPERRPRQFTLISVDDHLVEPIDAFEGRLPAKYQSRAPRVVELDDGAQGWEFDGALIPEALARFNAVAGKELEVDHEQHYERVRFEEMRRGAYDIHHRIRDMDIDGVYASVNYPSSLVGFGGARIQYATDDEDLALAVVRAYNDWHIEAWGGPYPDRIIPCQIPYLRDPYVGAAEIRANAARGFKAVTFPESPASLQLPSIHTSYWDPFLRACEETSTVVCLHTGSASSLHSNSPDAPEEAKIALFGAQAVFTAVDWLYSLCAVRFPGIQICLTEGGIGWLPGMLDRLDHLTRRLGGVPAGDPGPYPPSGVWRAYDVTPGEVLLRNFWFCALDDFAAFQDLDRIGADNVFVEVDYPHADSTWPDSHVHIAAELRGLPAEAIRRITWENASELFRHPVPAAVRRDPDAF